MSNDESSNSFEIDLPFKAGRISAKGEAASRMQQDFSDLISIFTQSIGWVGDKIAIRRIPNQTKLAEALLRVREIKEGRGQVVQRISPKLLIPWAEAVSKEDIDDSSISEIYAQILASADQRFDPKLKYFVEVCESISAKEAGLLRDICQPHFELSDIGGLELHHFIEDSLQREWGSFIDQYGDFPQSELTDRSFPNATQAKWLNVDYENFDYKTIDQILSIPRSIKLTVCWRSPSRMSTSTTVNRDFRYSFEILERKGILERRFCTAASDTTELVLDYYAVTSIGYEFCKLACGFSPKASKNDQKIDE